MADLLERLKAALADRYQIERELGSGGMATVYLAQDLRHSRQVAIKVFRPEIAAALGDKRFLREIETAAGLSHPHILAVHDSGAGEGLLYYVMPYVEGESLRARINREKQLPIEDTLQIAQEVADALAHAHRQGVIHRDIKPENILMYGGHAVIADFGIAKAVSAAGGERLTSTGMAVGTPAYMSPEQASGEEVDARSDIYALGCLVYEMFVGEPPFTGSTVSAIVSQHIAAPPPSASLSRHTVSEEASAAILKALAKTPADRFSSAVDFARALKGRSGAVSGAEPSVRDTADRATPFSWFVLAKVLGIYAVTVGVAFLLLDYLVNRFVLSPHLPDLAVVALLSLVPTVGIIAHGRARGTGVRWSRLGKVGIAANGAVSAVLIVLMFGTKDLGAATSAVVLTDEEGNSVERVVPKTEFRKRLVIFYFDSETTDSIFDWYAFGIPGGLEIDLSQDLFFQITSPEQLSDDLQARGYPDGVGLPLTLKRQLAENAHVPHFVSGSYSVEGDRLSVTMALYETARGRQLARHTFSGSDPFALADSMSVQLKHDLDIPERYIAEMEDMPVSALVTESLASFEHLMRGLVRLTTYDDWQGAASSLEQATREDPTNAYAQLFLYAVRVYGNDGEKAAGAIQAAMQHMYRLPEQLQFQVKTAYYDFMQQPEKAIAVSRMRIELSPEDLEGRDQLARLHLLRGEREEGMAQYEAILEIDPTQYEYLPKLGDLHLAKGEFDQAMEYYEEYAQHFPKDREAHMSLGRLHRILGQHERAKEHYERALLLEPENISTMVSLARLERSFGNYEAELAQLTRALELARTPQDRARVFAALRDYYAFRGMLARSIEYLELELAETQRFAAQAPFLIRRLTELGTYVLAGRQDEAERIYEAVAGELGPPYDRLLAIGRLTMALELEDAEAAEAALVDIEEFIRAFSAEALRPSVVQAQARIHEMRGEYQEAIRSREMELEFDHTDLSVNASIGRCYRKLGDLDRAGEYLNESRRISPSNPNVLYELALVAAEVGDITGAVEHLEAALAVWADADPEFKDARDAREKLAELRGGAPLDDV